MDKLIFGSNRKISLDRYKEDSDNKCTMYLIDTSLFETNNITTINGLYLTRLISDQHKDLWKTMKRGDFIYDVSDDKCGSKFPYVVDIEKDQPEHIKILRHGLIIKDPYTLWDQNGSIYPDMFTLTEFPIGYFDQYVYNDSMYRCSNNDIEFDIPCSIWLDVTKLKLNTLICENVFHVKIIEYPIKHMHYLYTVLTYKKKNYMIINKQETSQYHEDQYFVDMFIDYFKDPCLIQVLDLINYKVLEIAKNEQVLDGNILMIKIDDKN